VRPTAVRVAHAVALAASMAALALALRQSAPAFALLAALALAALVTPFLEWVSVPPFLVRRLPRVHLGLLLLSTVVAWLSRSMGVLVLDRALLPLVTSSLLVPMALVFALAPRTFASGRTLVAAIVFLLGLAGLDPAPAGYAASALPFLKDADHNAFAERYLPLAVVVLLALWAAALAGDGPRWRRRHVVGLAVSVVLALALAGTGIAGLPLMQPRVERAFAAALDQGQTGLGGESTLGEFAELAASRRRVLDLRSSLPSGGSWRLPSEVFTRFDGRRWSNGAAARLPVVRPTSPPASVGALLAGVGSWFLAPPADARAAVELRVDQAEVGRWPLLLPRGPAAVTAAASYLERDRFGLLRRLRGQPLSLYGALLTAGRARPAEPPELTGDEREESLALPPHVDPRTVELARPPARESPQPRGGRAPTLRKIHTRDPDTHELLTLFGFGVLMSWLTGARETLGDAIAVPAVSWIADNLGDPWKHKVLPLSGLLHHPQAPDLTVDQALDQVGDDVLSILLCLAAGVVATALDGDADRLAAFDVTASD
jgi:hypothetical protein